MPAINTITVKSSKWRKNTLKKNKNKYTHK